VCGHERSLAPMEVAVCSEGRLVGSAQQMARQARSQSNQLLAASRRFVTVTDH